MINDFLINNSKEDLYYKIMIIGANFVGKTQIMKRFCREDFTEKYYPTFGMDFRVQKYFFENITTTLQIIEVSNKNAPPKELLKDYILDADCFICVYDITKRDSVNELNNIISDYERVIGNDNKPQCWYFVGNKNDSPDRECSQNPSDIFGYTPLGTIGFIEVSAKENKFIENMLNNTIFQIQLLKRRRINSSKNIEFSNKKIVNISNNEIKKEPIKVENKKKCIIY